jgi:hypothetical protein
MIALRLQGERWRSNQTQESMAIDCFKYYVDLLA